MASPWIRHCTTSTIVALGTNIHRNNWQFSSSGVLLLYTCFKTPFMLEIFLSKFFNSRRDLAPSCTLHMVRSFKRKFHKIEHILQNLLSKNGATCKPQAGAVTWLDFRKGIPKEKFTVWKGVKSELRMLVCVCVVLVCECLVAFTFLARMISQGWKPAVNVGGYRIGSKCQKFFWSRVSGDAAAKCFVPTCWKNLGYFCSNSLFL